MQEIQDLINHLVKLRDELPKDAVEIAGAMAENHLAFIKRRIQAEGIPDKSYSEKGVAPYLVEKNMYARRNAGFDRMIKSKKKKKETVSWKDIREANGFQTNYVDFTFSGRTFQNLNVVSIQSSGYVARAFLGCTNAEESYRLFMGYKRYGDFLAPNSEEKISLNTIALDMTKKLFQKYKV